MAANVSELIVLARAIGFDKLAKEAKLVASGIGTIEEAQKRLGVAKGGTFEKSLAKMSGGTKENTKQLIGMGAATTDLGREGQRLAKGFGVTKQAAHAAQKEMFKDITQTRGGLQKFRMEFLSVMFFGMQVWRTFGGFFKSMIQNYKDLDSKGNRPLTRSLTKLSATFTYLKFQILDSMGPMLKEFLLMIANAFMMISDLDPNILTGIGIGLAIIAGVGLGAFVGAQVALFASSAANLIKLAGVDTTVFPLLGSGLKSIGAGLSTISTNIGLTGLATSLGVALGITTAMAFGLIAALLTVVAAVAYLGFKWNWNFDAMSLNAVAWGTTFLQWWVKFLVGMVMFWDVAWAWTTDTVSGAVNKAREILSSFFTWLTGMDIEIYPFQNFETDNLEKATQRFMDVQKFIDNNMKLDEEAKEGMADWEFTMANPAQEYDMSTPEGEKGFQDYLTQHPEYNEDILAANASMDTNLEKWKEVETNIKEGITPAITGEEGSILAGLGEVELQNDVLIEQGNTFNDTLSQPITKEVTVNYTYVGRERGEDDVSSSAQTVTGYGGD